MKMIAALSYIDSNHELNRVQPTTVQNTQYTIQRRVIVIISFLSTPTYHISYHIILLWFIRSWENIGSAQDKNKNRIINILNSHLLLPIKSYLFVVLKVRSRMLVFNTMSPILPHQQNDDIPFAIQNT